MDMSKLAGHSATIVDDAAGPAIKAAGKGGRVGLIAGAIGAGTLAYGLLGSEKSNAAPAPVALKPTAVNGVPTAGAPGAASAATETSTAETVSVGAGAFVAAKTLGLKAIPVVGGVLTAYDTLKETGSNLLNGEYKKAGTSLVAGAGLTVGATGGFLSYGLGEAWHAAVRDGAVATMGNDAKIEKAPLRSLFEYATGVKTDIELKPASPTVRDFQNAVNNSPIIVARPEVPQPAPRRDEPVFATYQ